MIIGLREIIQIKPDFARFLKIRFDNAGQPMLEDLRMSATNRVIVRSQLLD